MKNDTLEPQGIRSTFIPFEENRFKPVVKETEKDENLIDFRNKYPLWMHGVESNKNPEVKGFGLFVIFCAIAAGYFIFR